MPEHVLSEAVARPQIEEKLRERRRRSRFHEGLRITDDLALTCVKEASGRLRVEIEALLSMGLPNSPMAGADIRVASGNFITAKPIGVVGGVDFMYTGEVRKVEAHAVQKRLDDNELVLLSPLGYSPTGEVFNLAHEDVAAAAAMALKAEKLIYLMDSVGVTGRRGELLRELTVRQAEALITRGAPAETDARQYLPQAVRACRQGVRRAHLISGHVDDGLLLELFTRKGVGTMLTPDPIENLRPARVEDIGGVLRLIEATTRGAAVHGKPVAVCGGLASDPEAVPLLLGLGVTELSVVPGQIPRLKARVRGLALGACRELAQRALKLGTAREVRALVKKVMP